MRKILLTLILCSSLQSAFSASDFYAFDTIEKQQRFQLLTSQLRCLVCQNQNIAESNASLAVDLRQQIFHEIQQGKTDQDIIHYLVSRYGDFILYKPPFNFMTAGLWCVPFVFLLVALTFLFHLIRRNHRE